MDFKELLAASVEELCAAARLRRRVPLVTYSPKVFIPLTKLCRDVCHYCTFAAPPRRGERAYLTIDEVLEIAHAGEAAGCREALFTLGDKPELRHRAARAELAALGCETTLEYLERAARAVLDETGVGAARVVPASIWISAEVAGSAVRVRGETRSGYRTATQDGGSRSCSTKAGSRSTPSRTSRSSRGESSR